MIISVNWLKQYTDIDMPIDKLATLIGARLVEVESVEDLGEKYKDVVVAKVVTCEKLEGTDHLNVTKIDDGGVVKQSERDKDGLVQVVCGAPNVHADMTVAWLPPGSTVPETVGKEPFVLEARKLRGAVSNGMLASAKELDLYNDHAGILELDPTAVPGAKFMELYGLNDHLLDIENKSLTHRPDTFGIIGFAREVAGIQGKAFETPAWLKNTDPTLAASGEKLNLNVSIDHKDLSARYQAVILKNADSARQSSRAIQTYLTRIGMRPINAVVDVTNYLMMLTGQPLHAFDYDKLLKVGGGKADIHVRSGKKGEKLKLLDGRTIELSCEDVVIANGSTPVALAGAMGGVDTEIDDSTKTVVLESATFNLYNLRATQMRHGIFSEAITRFTKGQPAGLTAPVLYEAVRLLHEEAGAELASDVAEDYPGKSSAPTVEVSLAQINDLLGSNLSAKQVIKSLENVEFTVMQKDDVFHVTAPYWRADIHIPEDAVEEIGRLNGFDEIPLTLPTRSFTAVTPNEFDQFRVHLRELMTRAGANEVLTYSFVHGDLLKKASQDPKDSYKIVNSLSPDLQYYRQSLTPSLLSLVHPNIKAGYDSFAIYELNKVHNKVHGLDEEKVPGEVNMFTLTVTSKKQLPGAPYYHARRYLDFVAKELELELVYAPIEKDPGFPVTAPFDFRRSALVSDKASGEFIGEVGEYKPEVVRGFKLPAYTAGFEVSPEGLLKAVKSRGLVYKPDSRYPSTERDICFQVADNTAYQQVADVAQKTLSEQEAEVTMEPIDIYQGEKGKKNITLRFKLTSPDHTLAAPEVEVVMKKVSSAVTKQCQASVV